MKKGVYLKFGDILLADSWRAIYRLRERMACHSSLEERRCWYGISPSSHKASKDILRDLLADSWRAIYRLRERMACHLSLARKNGVPSIACAKEWRAIRSSKSEEWWAG